MEEVYKFLDKIGRGIKVNGKYISHIKFVDYVVVLTESQHKLQKLPSNLHAASAGVGVGENMDNKVTFCGHVSSRPVYGVMILETITTPTSVRL